MADYYPQNDTIENVAIENINNLSFLGIDATQIGVDQIVRASLSSMKVLFIGDVPTTADELLNVEAVGLIERTGPETYSVVPISMAGKELIDDIDAAEQRATLGAIASDPSEVVGSTAVSNIVFISQNDYDAIVEPDESTLYIING
jgi:hypothetical protein